MPPLRARAPFFPRGEGGLHHAIHVIDDKLRYETVDGVCASWLTCSSSLYGMSQLSVALTTCVMPCGQRQCRESAVRRIAGQRCGSSEVAAAARQADHERLSAGTCLASCSCLMCRKVEREAARSGRTRCCNAEREAAHSQLPRKRKSLRICSATVTRREMHTSDTVTNKETGLGQQGRRDNKVQLPSFGGSFLSA